tara:strand:+ start:589 stop:699 length:111 start_codon:yes stop_codon:yes gene_type:complete
MARKNRLPSFLKPNYETSLTRVGNNSDEDLPIEFYD